jgi:hypothetical protein
LPLKIISVGFQPLTKKIIYNGNNVIIHLKKSKMENNYAEKSSNMPDHISIAMKMANEIKSYDWQQANEMVFNINDYIIKSRLERIEALKAEIRDCDNQIKTLTEANEILNKQIH